jgi:hypothetical protein
MSEEKVQESEKDLANDEWFKDNYIQLMQKHPREWIAVVAGNIIATGQTKGEVVEKADEAVGDHEYSLYYIAPTATVTDSGYQH